MLSERLFALAEERAADNDVVLKGPHYFQRWIWRWLYIDQSAERAASELEAIESLVEVQHLKPDQLLTLALKAEILEQLLN
jgi:hypothetical protein